MCNNQQTVVKLMKIQNNKLASNNKAISENLNDNTIASNNQLLANNKVSIETRGAIDALFENTLEVMCMPKEKFKQIKSGLIVKQIENCQKILMRAKEIKDNFGINILPPPLKFSIPFMKEAACEHEEEMYDLWAKLLVEAAENYNPIQLQYAEILSQIGSREANLLKNIYYHQSKISIYSDLWLVINQITGAYGQKYYMYFNGETFNKENLIDILYPFNGIKDPSIILLEKLGLISTFFNQRLSSNRKLNEPTAGLYLTEFGYSMLTCLETKPKEKKIK